MTDPIPLRRRARRFPTRIEYAYCFGCHSFTFAVLETGDDLLDCPGCGQAVPSSSSAASAIAREALDGYARRTS